MSKNNLDNLNYVSITNDSGKLFKGLTNFKYDKFGVCFILDINNKTINLSI